MPWEYTENGVLGFLLLLIPTIMGLFSVMLIGIALDTGNKGGGTTASLMLVICILMLAILVPNQLGWLLEYCKK